jgi:hypothetical protein
MAALFGTRVEGDEFVLVVGAARKHAVAIDLLDPAQHQVLFRVPPRRILRRNHSNEPTTI